MRILGIETSCDESSAAIVQRNSEGDLTVLSCATHSQIRIHQPYGGVVPEIASRNHLETINQIIDRAGTDAGTSLDGIDGIAVTNRPGLVGSLLVGVSAAKTLAYVLNKPLMAIHHLEGHAASVWLGSEAEKIRYPLLLAIVSGGHTNLYVITEPPHRWPERLFAQSCVGRSRDDAAGEAFDKIAKVLGFPYPGGKWIDQTAKNGDRKAFDLPRALPQKSTLDFSFSGLKTAAALAAKHLEQEGTLQERIPDLCASVQEAIVDALLAKMTLGVRKHRCRSVALVGGVAANSRLRARLSTDLSQKMDVPVFLPPLQYCTDNGAMIAAAGVFRFLQNHVVSPAERLSLSAVAYPEN